MICLKQYVYKCGETLTRPHFYYCQSLNNAMYEARKKQETNQIFTLLVNISFWV